LKQAESDLTNAKQREANNAGNESEPTGPEAPKAKEADSTPSLIALMSAIFSLLILILLTIALLVIRKGFKNFQLSAEQRFEVLLRKQGEYFKTLSALTTDLTDARIGLTNLHNDVKKLMGQVALIEPRPRPSEPGRPRDYPPKPQYQPAVKEPRVVIAFPTSAASFLARLNGHEPTITLDALRNLLIRDSDGQGEFVLIDDPRAPRGLSYVIPSMSRLQAREDFFNHFKQFYECDLPKAGEVWVNKPALVGRVDDGWQLRERGVLEIK
jgi:hypothetical protein